MPFRLSVAVAVFLCASCSVTKQLRKSAEREVLNDSALRTAHVGISVYEPATGKRWFDYQGDKYFVPASNTKLPTCYAAMKYLGDSLVGLRYGMPEEGGWRDRAVVIDATGDPSFMHEDFKTQPVFDFFKRELVEKNRYPGLLFKGDNIQRWGSGWSWNDYQSAYMAERSRFPIYGNTISVSLNDVSQRVYTDTFLTPGKKRLGKLFKISPVFFDSLINTQRVRVRPEFASSSSPNFKINRNIANNDFTTEAREGEFVSTVIPFVTQDGWTAANILEQMFKRTFALVAGTKNSSKYSWEADDGDIDFFNINKWHTIHSQPTDSLLRPLMHHSDNFFAEQALLMVSNERLGFMNDAAIIDTLLKTDFADLPQKPRWADGSGLSRYNLFTPQDFVAILAKMKNEFGMARIKEILPTGGEGTLSSFYKTDSGFLYAKTGTLSGVVALSGFLYTKSGKELIFSVLVNNHQASSTAVRRAVEKFIQGIRQRY